MQLTTTILSLSTDLQRNVLKSFTGSLNMSIIGYLQQHFRQNDKPADHVPTIDDYNDAQAQDSVDDANVKFREDNGLEREVSPLELATAIIHLRASLATRLRDIARPRFSSSTLRVGTAIHAPVDKNELNPRDLALPVADSVNFRLTQAPAINERALEQLAEAINRPVQELRAAQLVIFEDERKQLQKYSSHIVGTYEEIEAGIIGNEFEDADGTLDTLPIHVQYKLWATLIKCMRRAESNELKSLLRFNRMDAAGNMKILEATTKQVAAYLDEFVELHSSSIDAYLDRGGQLKTTEQMLNEELA